MPQTFEAILRGDRLEWVGAAPPTGEVRVRVTVPDEPAYAGPPFKLVPVPGRPGALIAEESLHLTPEERGRLMADALAAIAANNPDGWSDEFMREWRESRKDRPLPGREDG